jgi:hypothetical protein
MAANACYSVVYYELMVEDGTIFNSYEEEQKMAVIMAIKCML